MTRSVTMTTMPNITTSSLLSMSSDVMVSHTPSSVRMSYTTVPPMSYNSSVWPTLAASVSRPFVCTGESCTQEVQCLTGKLNIHLKQDKCRMTVLLYNYKALRLNILWCKYLQPCHDQSPKQKNKKQICEVTLGELIYP